MAGRESVGKPEKRTLGNKPVQTVRNQIIKNLQTKAEKFNQIKIDNRGHF